MNLCKTLLLWKEKGSKLKHLQAVNINRGPLDVRDAMENAVDCNTSESIMKTGPVVKYPSLLPRE